MRSVRVAAARLILDEVFGLPELAHVVVIGADPHQKAIGPDPLGGRLADRGDGDRVVVRSRSHSHEFAQQRVLFPELCDEIDFVLDQDLLPEHGAHFGIVVDPLQVTDREIVLERDHALVATGEIQRFAQGIGGMVTVGDMDGSGEGAH